MSDENPEVNVAASIIVTRLSEWIERMSARASAQSKSAEELVRDFGFELAAGG